MPTAIVLSGGGSRGDFEVGALRRRYDVGKRPDILCCCSVGSILGAKLAEGKGVDEQGVDRAEKALAELEDIWKSLRVNEDMWLNEPWLGFLENSEAGKKLKAFL